MEKQDVVVVEKKSTFWTVLKVILILAIVCFVAYKIYQKISKKRKAAALEAEEASLLDFSDDELENDDSFIVSDGGDAVADEDMQ